MSGKYEGFIIAESKRACDRWGNGAVYVETCRAGADGIIRCFPNIFAVKFASLLRVDQFTYCELSA